MITESYASRTYDSPNPLRRFAHRTRFNIASHFIPSSNELTLLDFGCGDAIFLNQIYQRDRNKPNKLYGYEPITKTIDHDNILVLKNWQDILKLNQTKGSFNYVTCFEVLEHFNTKQQERFLLDMSQVMNADSKLIVSVPIEKGMPSIVKNLLRKIKSREGKHVYSWKNIFKSIFKFPIDSERSRDGYLNHMGFYYDDLEGLIEKYFEIEVKTFSPFKNLGVQFNSQVFYKLKKKA